MTTLHSTRNHLTHSVLRGTRFRGTRFRGKCLRRYLCLGAVAVTMIQCAQAAPTDTNTAVSSAALTSAAVSTVVMPKAGSEGAYHQTFDRNTDLNALSFLHTHYTVTDAVTPALRGPTLSLDAPVTAGSAAFSQRDFRPRGRSIFDTVPSAYASDNPNGLHTNNTVWQQMGDYRGHGRVRVLTLWECTSGNVSLQAGKGGNPSLQWTSSWVSSDDAKRGVLDSLFAVSIAGAANTIRSVTRGVGQQGVASHDATKLAAAAAAETTIR